MTNPQLPYMTEYLGRFDPRAPQWSDAPSESLLRRLIVGIGRGLRRHPPPPYLSDHLCRDIGIEPMPKRQEWFWPW